MNAPRNSADERQTVDMTKWILVGTALQTAMVLAGHWTRVVAQWFGPLGTLISLVAGLLWVRSSGAVHRRAVTGGAIVGGACALIGIAISLVLGDVQPVLLVLGTASSAVTGALGGWIGARFGRRATASQT